MVVSMNQLMYMTLSCSKGIDRSNPSVRRLESIARHERFRHSVIQVPVLVSLNHTPLCSVCLTDDYSTLMESSLETHTCSCFCMYLSSQPFCLAIWSLALLLHYQYNLQGFSQYPNVIAPCLFPSSISIKRRPHFEHQEYNSDKAHACLCSGSLISYKSNSSIGDFFLIFTTL